MSYGLTDQGFIKKTLQVIRADMNAALQSAFGLSINLGDKSIFGQIVGILAATYAALWDQLEAVYASQDPDKATGASLDALSALTGTFRPAASYSTVMVTLFGTPATVVPAGNKVQTTSTGKQFTVAACTIASVPNWAASTTYAVGDRVFSDVDRIYQCTVAGTSGTLAVNGVGTDLIDGGVHWKLIGDNLVAGSGAVDAIATATETGAITAVAGDITTIVNGVSGWTQVVNLVDAALGRDVATDEELRTLREEELSGEGESPPDALRAALLKIANIRSVTIFTNNTDFTDTSVTPNMPPHSVEALILPTWDAGDPLDQQVYDTLFKNVAAGIVTSGNQTGSSMDDQGTAHVVKFSRPTEVPIYVVLNVIVDPAVFAADGIAQVQSAIATWGAKQLTGKDAVASAISAKSFSVDGVLDVTSCLIGTAPGPSSSATISIDTRHLATYDTSRIIVNVTNGTP
jgi:uncharacterized phage protein gp47/JayE